MRYTALHIKNSIKVIKENKMTVQRTFSIIKPDAVAKNVIGGVESMIEAAGLKVVAMKMIKLDRATAEAFYAEHSERPFFGELVDFMMSGPCVVQVLEGKNAIKAYRDIMGATNPNNAEAGTIRHSFALPVEDLSANAVHGSDSEESAAREIPLFFKNDEIVG